MNQEPSRKKVLYLITKSNWGGAQRYVYDLASHIDQQKFEPVVALGGEGDLSTLLGHAHIKVINIRSLQRDISIQKELQFVKELWKILRAEKPDILHVNSSKAGGVGTLLGRLSGVKKVVFTAHGWAFNEDRPWWQKLFIKALHWITVMFSHRTIAVSSAIVRQMDWPFVEQKMKTINPGRTIGPMYKKVEARNKLSEIHPPLTPYLEDQWVITIAEMHPIKRLSILVEVMKKTETTAPNLRSLIIGDGELKEKLEHMIKVNGLESRVFLLGSIPEAARFLKAGDIFVLPSKSESYGYVIHEAGLAHLPVIATNVGGITDIIVNGKSGRLIPPGDAKALENELIDYTKNTGDWTKFADNLLAEMEKRTVEKMAETTEVLYLLK